MKQSPQAYHYMYVCIPYILGGGGANFRVELEKALRIKFVTATQSKGAVWRKQCAHDLTRQDLLIILSPVTVLLLFLRCAFPYG